MRSMNHYVAQTAAVAVWHYVRLRDTLANEPRVTLVRAPLLTGCEPLGTRMRGAALIR